MPILRRTTLCRQTWPAWCCLVAYACCCGLVFGLLPATVRGQEPNGLQAAIAIEKALVETIAKNRKSIVAIARVAKADAADLKVTLNRTGQIVLGEKAKPGDPDFVPNQYGTGVVVGKQGLILTAYHVLGDYDAQSESVENRYEFFVTTAERRTYPAKVKAADPRSDLAVLEVDANNLAPITFGDGGKLDVGQIVVSLGNPYAIARDGQASASWGIVANFSRKAAPKLSDDARLVKDKLYHFGTLIQTDARLNLGVSGGALLNLHGEMIGLTTSLADAPGYDSAAGYALAVDEMFRRIVDTLRQGREVEYGFLGIQPTNLDERERRAGLRGMRVSDVVFGTPAKRSGLEIGDVVTHVNGQEIADADSLMLNLSRLPIDTAVKMNVVRGEGQKLQISAELSKYPVAGKRIFTTSAPAWRGLHVDYWTMSAPFVQTRSIPRGVDPEGCVVIVEVDQGSPAEAANLKPNMFISQVGQAPVRSPRDFHAAVAEKTGEIELFVRTEDENRRVKLKGG